MSEQAAAANANGEKKKGDKKKKGKGKTTRVVAMASVPMVVGEEVMGSVFRIETSKKIIEIKNKGTESTDGNGNAKADEMEEGEIAADGEGGVKAEVQGNGDAVMPVVKPEGNGEAPAAKPAAGDAPKE